jgi:hypothetical protein
MLVPAIAAVVTRSWREAAVSASASARNTNGP